jgi:hypothetical protein
MRLVEMEFRKAFEREESAKELLNKHGFREIDSGQFASIYANPKFPYVLKVFEGDSCYQMYCEIVLTNQSNPHFPKFRGRPMLIIETLNGAVYAIRMERLTPHPNTSEIRSLIDYMGSRMGRSGYNVTKERAAAYRKAYPKLNAAISLIKGLLKYGCVGDFKYANIMMRGDVPVLIDPVANEDY